MLRPCHRPVHGRAVSVDRDHAEVDRLVAAGVPHEGRHLLLGLPARLESRRRSVIDVVISEEVVDSIDVALTHTSS